APRGDGSYTPIHRAPIDDWITPLRTWIRGPLARVALERARSGNSRDPHDADARGRRSRDAATPGHRRSGAAPGPAHGSRNQKVRSVTAVEPAFRSNTLSRSP